MFFKRCCFPGKFAVCLFLSFCFLFVGAKALALPSAPCPAVVNNPNPKDRLHLRDSISPDGKNGGSSKAKFYNGVIVQVQSYLFDGDWAFVQVGAGIGELYGYMQTKYLAFGDEAMLVQPAMPAMMIANPVPTDRLNLRAGPSASSLSIQKYPNGYTVTVMGVREDGWVYVLADGVTGYMMEKYLEPAPDGGGQAADRAVVRNPNPKDRLHLRAGPSASARSLGKYYNGVAVTVMSAASSNNYYRVKIGEQTGYMDGRYLVFGGAGGEVASAMPVRAVSNPAPTDRLNLRKAPSDASASLGKYYNGTLVTVMGVVEGGWVHVQVDGKTGYMMEKFLSQGAGGDMLSAWVHNPNAKDRLNLRAGPGENYASLGKYYNGVQARLINSVPKNGYCYVYIGGDTSAAGDAGGRYGYMAAKYLSFQAVQKAYPRVSYTGPVTVYALPSYSSDILNAYASSVDVTVLGISDGWWHVTAGGGGDGVTGYVPALYAL